MEYAALIVSFGVLVVSGVAAAAAVVQARAANTSRIEAQKARDEAQELARTATAAFVRSAAAQEKANAIKERELAPPDWTHQYVSGDLYRILNTSKRTIRVERIDVRPEGTEGTIGFVAASDNDVYEYGDVIEYLRSRRLGGNAKKLTLFWRFEDEPESELSAFIIAL